MIRIADQLGIRFAIKSFMVSTFILSASAILSMTDDLYSHSRVMFRDCGSEGAK